MHNNFNNLIDTFKMMYFMNMKDTSNYQNIIMVLLITLVTIIMNNETYCENLEAGFKSVFGRLFRFRPKYNIVILEGKRCVKVTNYLTKTDNLFSNRFSAFWYYISKNNLCNPSITSLKEYANSSNIYDDFGDPKGSRSHKRNFDTSDNSSSYSSSCSNMSQDIFVVDQAMPFKITKDIYCKVYKNTDKGDDKRKFDMENIVIEIYSYTLSLKMLAEFLDNLYFDFCREMDRMRKNKKFIYTLIGPETGSGGHNNYDNEMVNEWEECEFVSTRKFENLFFDDKKRLQDKIDFFVCNKSWYDYEGHPYTFGIGLHGPPGTGKTSIIKCIANQLNRHIIVIPLNKIKTQREFSQYFFEQFYNHKNSRKIGFKDKIIVFEDIDCMSDIVKKRDTDASKSNSKSKDETGDAATATAAAAKQQSDLLSQNSLVQTKLLNKIAKKIDDDHKDTVIVDLEKTNNDKITLSFILNIIDGIRETPGRIMIITSNNYDSLDPALIRPGRIDITLEMRNASVNVIKEMYNHYYKDTIPKNVEEKMKDFVVSPAKIVNMRLENEQKEDFLVALKKEFKEFKEFKKL